MPPLPPPPPPPPLNAVERSIKQEPPKPFIHLSKFYNNKIEEQIASSNRQSRSNRKKEKSINLTVLHYSVVIRIQQIFVAGTNLSCAFSNALATRDRKI